MTYKVNSTLYSSQTVLLHLFIVSKLFHHY